MGATGSILVATTTVHAISLLSLPLQNVCPFLMRRIGVHDVEVTNRDKCVTIKSPASNMLIEQVWCNQSGGCAFGSLGADTAISNIVYKSVGSTSYRYRYMLTIGRTNDDL